MSVVSLWFGLSRPVSRAQYLASGATLMGVKYAVEAATVRATTGNVLLPHHYISPLLTTRDDLMSGAPEWLLVAMMVWTLPFVWIGASMTLRRVVDAGRSPWLALLFFVPIVNYVVMLVFAALPSQPIAPQDRDVTKQGTSMIMHALVGVAVSLGIAVTMAGLTVLVIGRYSGVLFVTTPFLMGAVSAYLYNRAAQHGLLSTLAVSTIAVVMASGGIMLFAFEGVICIVMAMPLAAGAAAMGAAIGRSMANGPRTPGAQAALLVLALPLLAGAESLSQDPPIREVRTSIEIDQPPARVWPHVVSFTELDAPPKWFFDLGIAYPQRARIEGEGVGAVRYCEFSTGPFVEPITRWEPPHRLSFDVRSSPPPMHHISPYRHFRATKALDYMQSKRGEFRLVALPNGRTRLEGSTWYSLDLGPRVYWTIWGDAIIHRIHQRVLEHIAKLAGQGV